MVLDGAHFCDIAWTALFVATISADCALVVGFDRNDIGIVAVVLYNTVFLIPRVCSSMAIFCLHVSRQQSNSTPHRNIYVYVSPHYVASIITN